MTTPPPPPPEYIPPTGGGAGSSDDKTMALIAHFGMIIFGFLPALIIYFVKGDNPWVKKEAAKAFNFSVIFSVLVIGFEFLSLFFSIVLDTAGFIATCIGCLLIPASWITMIIFGIMNGIKVNNDEESKYPFEVPILK